MNLMITNSIYTRMSVAVYTSEGSVECPSSLYVDTMDDYSDVYPLYLVYINS